MSRASRPESSDSPKKPVEGIAGVSVELRCVSFGRSSPADRHDLAREHGDGNDTSPMVKIVLAW